MIVFSAKISDKHKKRLTKEFPGETFVFCSSKEELKPYLKQATVYVTYGKDMNEAVIEEAEQLKWIHVLSAGVDGFPFKQLEEKKIIVTNVRGIHIYQMSEYAISMLLQVYRNEKAFIYQEQKQVWNNTPRIREIGAKTMLIAGTGAIGKEVARLAKAFRMKTIGISSSGKVKEHFDETYQASNLLHVLPEADFVVSVLPSTAETKEFFTYKEFQAMSNHAIFLNMGRGDAVNETDLLKAIQEEEISHAVLDVFQEEPLPKEHPFWKEENITITPHVAGNSPEYMKRAIDIFATNLKAYQKEKPLINVIDLIKGY